MENDSRAPLLTKLETLLLLGVSSVAAIVGAVVGIVAYYQHWLG